jgi:hypothetical protein
MAATAVTQITINAAGSSTDHGGGKRRYVTALCHIAMPKADTLDMVGTDARCRLHRHWLFDRVYAFGGGESSPAT